EAFGRAAAVIDSAGARSVPDHVRELLRADLARWDGRPAGASRAWADRAVAGLPGEQRVAARLALLAAKAPYQVDDAVVDAFRAVSPDDGTLIELTSWASLA